MHINFIRLLMILLLGACTEHNLDSQALTVAVASSLADPIKELSKTYMLENPTKKVYLNIGSSSFLETQIRFKADAHLFLAAHPEHLERLEAMHLLRGRRPLLSNTLVVLCGEGVEDGQNLGSLLRRKNISHLALALPSVPVGFYADTLLDHQGLKDIAKPKISYADSARAVVNLVEQGGAEVGIVYRTDAHKLKHARACLSIDPSLHPPIIYEVAEIRCNATKEASADTFSSYLAEKGKPVFTKYGFGELQNPL